jgi:hypothetical protein
MTEPRLKTHIRIAAHLRRAQGAGAFAFVAKKGDPDAGAVAVKVFVGRRDGDGMARLFVQSVNDAGERAWREMFEGPVAEKTVDAFLVKERRIDPDLWIVEIEDRDGRSFLEE